MHGIPLLATTDEALILAKEILIKANLPKKAAEYALHIAVATVNDIDYLLTRNCKHIANAVLIPRIEKVCDESGYRCPRICMPQELMETE